MIVFEDLTKSYGRKEKPAVDSIDLTVRNGEILGFAGLNGAGKTTTIRAAAGIIMPSSGTILVDEHDILKEKVKASRGIGWVPEFPNFEPDAKPLQLMSYYAGFYNIGGTEARELSLSLLKEVGLTPALNKKLRSYSQGMKKRFSVASALISSPDNFLFDETLNGLDPEGIKYIKNLMIKLKNQNKAVFLSSHILSELQSVADRVAIIHHGKLIKIVEGSELRSLGRNVINIRIDNIDDKVSEILSPYGKVEINGKDVTIMNPTVNGEGTSKINSELSKSGYMVSRINIEGESLENYFFSLVGENE